MFNEALYMGVQIKHSLFNPNQLRHYGCEIKDNPYSGEMMSITSPQGELEIPLQFEGTTLRVTMWTPTQDDLKLFPHIVLSSLHAWNPHDVWFPRPSQSAKEEFEMCNASAVRQINDNKPSDFVKDDENCIFRVGHMTHRMISSVRIPDVLAHIARAEEKPKLVTDPDPI